MNGLNLMMAPSFYLEIGQGSLKALNGEAGLELPLERQPNGRLTAACKEKLTVALQGFLKKSAWQPRARVFCAIGARGVSLRRFTLPAANRENVSQLLRLQIENELPLSPDELAWGYRPLGANEPSPGNSSPGQQDYLVAAVRKEVVEEYTEILTACGVTPVFTLAALARSYLCRQPSGSYAVLDIGRNQSELLSFEDGVPTALRILAWGGETITQTIAEELGVSRDEAEKLKLKLDQTPTTQIKVQAALEAALDALVGSLNGHLAVQRVYLTGKPARHKELALRLSQRLAPGVICEPLEGGSAEGCSAAILGLRSVAAQGTASPPLVIQVKQTNGHASVARPAPWKYVGVAALLALGLLALPYLEALLFKPHLVKRLAALKADRGRLPIIDRELEFLQYLKQNQPPYLDTLFLLAKAAPQGAKIDSLSMNRRGDLSWRGSMKDAQQVADFRSKLIDSGLFASVSVEEQTPTPDRQKLMVRMSAQWKPLAARQNLALGPTAEEIEKAKTRKRDAPGAPPMMPGMSGMPGGPPGMPSMGGPPRMSSRRSMSGPSNGPQPAGEPPRGAMPSSSSPREGGPGREPGRGAPNGMPANVPPPNP